MRMRCLASSTEQMCVAHVPDMCACVASTAGKHTARCTARAYVHHCTASSRTHLPSVLLALSPLPRLDVPTLNPFRSGRSSIATVTLANAVQCTLVTCWPLQMKSRARAARRNVVTEGSSINVCFYRLFSNISKHYFEITHAHKKYRHRSPWDGQAASAQRCQCYQA